MRCFIAVDTPRPTVSGFQFSEAPAHLTLRFLGERTEAEVRAVAEQVAPALRPLLPFALRLHGAGAFPTAERPRVVWVGVGEGGRELIEIEHRISEVLGTLGIPPEPRPFFPHVTLFRVRDRPGAERAARTIVELKDRDLGDAEVREVQLKESRLTPSGAVHRVLATFPLTGGP